MNMLKGIAAKPTVGSVQTQSLTSPADDYVPRISDPRSPVTGDWGEQQLPKPLR